MALFLISALLLVAARPAPPPVLAPYIKDGRFDPGDYRWMRGRFADATPEQKAELKAIDAWLFACGTAEAERVKRELVALGIAHPKLTPHPMQDRLCGSVGLAIPYGGQTESFARFERDLATARPIASAFLFATVTAEAIGGPRGPTLADKLLARTLGEQSLQVGLNWGQGNAALAPPLDKEARAIVVQMLLLALDDRNHANTNWFKEIVDKEGWPLNSQVGERAAYQAWVLAQHSDHDPAFQLKVLRLMEPLVGAGEVSKDNYAYIYDRVMLKIAGKQRYATQMTCRGGKHVPQPLENEAKVAKFRQQAGLPPLADYVALMQSQFGNCTSPPGSP